MLTVLALSQAFASGLFFVTIDHAAHDGGVAWAVSVTRDLAHRAGPRDRGRRGVACCAGDLRAAGIVGLLDAGANAPFALALTACGGA